MIDRDPEVLRAFVEEAAENLAALEPDLLLMEERGDNTEPEVIHRVFRAVHSTKGGASFLGCESVTRLSHALEHVLSSLRSGTLRIHAELIDALLAAVDVLRVMVADLEHADAVPHGRELERLHAFLPGASHTPAGPEASASKVQSAGGAGLGDFEPTPEALRACLARGMRLYRLDVSAGGDAAVAAEQKLARVGQCLDRRPPGLVLAATVLDLDMLQRELALPSGGITPLDAEAAKRSLSSAVDLHEAPAPAEDEPLARGEAPETLRVRVGALDRLMNLAGELVLARNQLLELLRDNAEGIAGLAAVLTNVDRVTTDLQDGIMRTRMQPVGTLFSRYSRVVRDLARQLGKRVELVTDGSDVELDKSIIEGLSDPLTHLVRNSIGHGIEPPSERQRVGKPPIGRVTLRAFQQGGQVNVAVSDDGRGFEHERVLQRAVEIGLLTPDDSRKASPEAMVALALSPGLSTAEGVSAVAGRGVGLDVVRANVERLGGRIEVDTEPNAGTTVLLQLPLTLAIIPCLVVGVGSTRFAVPQASLVELVWVTAEEVASRVEDVHGAPVLRLRGRLLPLVRLAQVLAVAEVPGVEVVGVASDGRHALARLERGDIDFVILDVEMPELGGLETLDAIRRAWPEVGVVLVSGVERSAAELTVEALARGAVDFVPNGEVGSSRGSKAALFERLRDILSAFRAQRHLARARRKATVGASRARRADGAAPLPSGARTVFAFLAVAASTGGP